MRRGCVPALGVALFGVIAAGACVAGCAAPARTVKLDEMSAEDHRREAARERARADDDYARYHPTASMPTPGGGPIAEARQMPIDMFPFNPTGNALRQAEAHLRHAREHDAAAALLERYENVECGALPQKARAACPILGPVTRIEDLPDGVRVSFRDDVPVDAVATQMRCHQAFARARAYQDASDCPLYMPGVEITRSSDGQSIELRSSRTETARELQIRSRLTSTH